MHEMSFFSSQTQFIAIRRTWIWRFCVSSASLIIAIAGSAISDSSAVAGDATPLFKNDAAPGFISATQLDRSDEAGGLEVDRLDARFQTMQEQLDKLRESFERSKKELAAVEAAASKRAVTAKTIYPTAKLTGFFQADAGWFQQNANSTAQLADLQDNRGFRRARLGATGKVADNVSYLLEMDFALAGRPSFRDARMDISDIPVAGNVRVGAFKQPFGMDELTSVKEITFIERSSLQGMAPFRQFGISMYDKSEDENVTWAASAFGTGTDQFGGSFGDSGYGMASRITAVAMEDKQADFLIHTGLGYSFINSPTNQFQYRGNPEYLGPQSAPGVPAAVSGIPFFTDTGLIAAKDANLFNGELASTWGPWHAQSEMRYNLLNQTAGGSVGFPSFYAQTGYILTGEHRPYNKPQAVLGRVKPTNAVGKGGAGAWELAARYSWVDLNQGAVQGGELHNMTYGLNWYLNDFTKFQFNYINSDLNRGGISDGLASIYCVRCQVDF